MNPEEWTVNFMRNFYDFKEVTENQVTSAILENNKLTEEEKSQIILKLKSIITAQTNSLVDRVSSQLN